MIGVIGDYQPQNETHATLDASLAHAGAEWEWVPTDAVPGPDELVSLMERTGFAEVRYRLLAGGIVALHTGRRRDG